MGWVFRVGTLCAEANISVVMGEGDVALEIWGMATRSPNLESGE